MKDRDPRPMPPDVLGAHRDPIDLLSLLDNVGVYTLPDLAEVRDALLRSLLERHGDVWVASGNEEIPVSRVQIDRPLKSITFLTEVPDYGGREETLPMLAQAMQPRWAAWWKHFSWRRRDDIAAWLRVVRHVLGHRQWAWLTAQYARSVVDRAGSQDLNVGLRAIESAERWARSPSEVNRRAAASAADAAAATADRGGRFGDAAFASLNAAAAAANAAAVTSAVFSPYAINHAYAAYVPYLDLEELTKNLITPTLVTSASRGLRASGVIRRATVPAAIGAIAGAGAMFLSKRA